MPDVRTSSGPSGSRWDVVAFALLVVGVGLTACIVTHRPALVGDSTAYAHSESDNLLGLAGALLAESLLEVLGYAIYVLLAAWTAVALTLFFCKRPWLIVRRMAGWALLVVCAAVIFDHFGTLLKSPLQAGNGGTVGAGLSQALRMHFSLPFRVVLFAACMCAAAWLIADFFVLWLGRALHWSFGRLIRLQPRMPTTSATAGKRRRALLERPASEQSEKNAVPISRSAGDDAPASAGSLLDDYELPPIDLLEDPEPFPHEEHDQHLREVAALLEKTFGDFNLSVRVVGIHTGPVITQYEIALETGLRVNKVTALSDDLALNLKVPSVRIVAPIPGKNTVGIEVPNEHRAVVRLKELLLASATKIQMAKLPLLLGKDTEGRSLVYDLSDMPHLLIAGRTGTGKSVCMNAIILSLLLTKRPDECRLIMIDPKKVEFSDYGKLPHLMCPVVKDDSKAEAILAWAVDKMEERYELLARARVRNIAAYNALSHEEILRRVQPADDERNRVPEKIPFIVIIIDEIGDLMLTMKKEVEGHIIRLAQKSRAAGIHLVLATQKPTVDVITGLIKSNLPARICFQVSSRSDSRVVLDEMGADKLLGKGDMLFLQPGTSTLIRAQGAFAGDSEIQSVVEYLECEPHFETELLQLKPARKDDRGDTGESLKSRDPLYEQAIEVVVREGRGSVSLLQRALGIGYGRAARLIDYMAEDGIVGHYNGAQAREVLFTYEQWEATRRERAAAAESM